MGSSHGGLIRLLGCFRASPTASEKLDMDFGGPARLCRSVTEEDNDRLALAKALSTQAGMLFEDASSEVILVGDLSADALRQTLLGALDMHMRAGIFLEAAVSLLPPHEQAQR